MTAVAPPATEANNGTSASGNNTNVTGASGAGVGANSQPLPGVLPPDYAGPLATLSVDEMNVRHLAGRQARADRLEAESRGFDSVFAQ